MPSRRQILTWALAASPLGGAWAHSSFIATYDFAKDATGRWLLTISLPLGGLHHTLLQQYPETRLWSADGAYNTELAAQYLITHTQVVWHDAQGKAWRLSQTNGAGLVKSRLLRTQLSDHQSNFVFELDGMPKAFQRIELAITAMHDIPHQTQVVKFRTALVRRKAVLSRTNRFRAQLSWPN